MERREFLKVGVPLVAALAAANAHPALVAAAIERGTPGVPCTPPPTLIEVRKGVPYVIATGEEIPFVSVERRLSRARAYDADGNRERVVVTALTVHPLHDHPLDFASGLPVIRSTGAVVATRRIESFDDVCSLSTVTFEMIEETCRWV